MHNADDKILWTNKKIAEALTQLLDEPVSPTQAGHWGRTGLIPIRKVGTFTCTTMRELRERFGLKPAN
jgi:hypothetical protein